MKKSEDKLCSSLRHLVEKGKFKSVKSLKVYGKKGDDDSSSQKSGEEGEEQVVFG